MTTGDLNPERKALGVQAKRHLSHGELEHIEDRRVDPVYGRKERPPVSGSRPRIRGIEEHSIRSNAVLDLLAQGSNLFEEASGITAFNER